MAVAKCNSCGKDVVLRDGACVLCGDQVFGSKAKQPSVFNLFIEKAKEFREHCKQVKRHRVERERSEAVASSTPNEADQLEQAILNAEERIARKKAGNSAGWASVIFAVLGIFTLGVVFVPIALLLSVTGFFQAMGARNGNGELINVLGFLLGLVGLLTSPALLLILSSS